MTDDRTTVYDLDLDDRVQEIVDEMALTLIEASLEMTDDYHNWNVYDSDDRGNELTTEWAKEADLADVFAVADQGPLDREMLEINYLEVTDEDGEHPYDLETAVRYYAAVNLQHMVLDRLDSVTRHAEWLEEDDGERTSGSRAPSDRRSDDA